MLNIYSNSIITNYKSVYKRYYPFNLFRIQLVAKLFLIPLVDVVGTRTEVGESPKGEHGACPRPGEDGEAYPFHKLTEIVGRGHIAEHATLGQIMLGVALLTEITDDVVTLDVDIHADDEHQETGDETRVGEPIGRVIVCR